MRLPIHLQREIVRLHFYEPNQSHRAIGRAVGVSFNTVRSLRIQLLKMTLSWAELQLLDDDAWCTALNNRDNSIAQRKQAPDWQWVHTELQRDDATLEQVWREWREDFPKGVQYSQFTQGYRSWRKAQHIVFRRIHRQGENLYVDYAGRTMKIHDPKGGPPIVAQIFVAVLGFSNFTYVEARESQSTADWVRCHVNCFNAMGGAPEWVVSDNLKAAVWRREKDRVIINPAYQDCLRHFDTAPAPTGVRKPKHKAKVEVGVQIVQRWMLFPLRDRVFFSLEELNRELKRRTEELNAHPFKKLPGCRRDRFLQSEQAALKPLPGAPYDPCDWRYAVRVGDDYHVEHDGRYYSVPSQHAGERVDYRFSSSTIEIFFRGRRVSLHALKPNPGDVSTLQEHRPIAHQRVLEGEPLELLKWATSVGPNTLALFRHHLEDRNDGPNGLKAARRLRDNARNHGDIRFEEVCAYALPLNITSLRSITSILKQSPDKRPRVSASTAQRPDGHLRGGSYYAEGK